MDRSYNTVNNVRALVVDDEPTVRLTASECLRRDGYSVIEAESGERAIDIIRKDSPGVVLLDVMMPRVDGFEVCACIRGCEETLNLPVLMMTGLDDKESIKRAYEVGATDFITKPINWELLSYRVRYILRASRTFERLCEAEDKNGAILHALPDNLFILDKNGTVLETADGNDGSGLYPYSCSIVGRNLGELLPDEVASRSAVHITSAIDTGSMQVFDYKIPVQDQERYFEARVKSFGKDTALALLRDITERKLNEKNSRDYQHCLEKLVEKRTSELHHIISCLEAEVVEKQKIAEELTMLDMAAKTTSTGITITGLDGRIVYSNPSDARMHGYEPEELVGKDIRIFSPPERLAPMNEKEISFVAPWCRESVNVRKDNTTFPVKLVSSAILDDDGKALGMVTTCEDITEQKLAEKELKRYHDQLEQLVEMRTNDLNDTVAMLMSEVDIRKKHEEKIEHLAYHDGLTGLPNRTLFSKRLWHELHNAQDSSRPIALMYIDLDNFKNINDTLGHTIGDFILCEVGKRLANVIRKEDSIIPGAAGRCSSIVSRLGGDEFILLLSDIDNNEDVEKVANRIIDIMAAPVKLDCHEIFITPSIGIALYPEHGYDADTLLMNADTAMYSAKNDGKNTYRFYSSAMNEESLRKLMIENDLHKALGRDEFSVYYQPQYDMKTGHITCLEALVRWEHRKHGMIMPDVFIPIAEQHGLIIPIGRRVIKKVCKQIMEWRSRNIDPVKVAINVSSRQFQQNFSGMVRSLLNECACPPEMIEFEITESSIMRDPVSTKKTLDELKALGVSISIDDFGTGYSSLNYLRKFPIDLLKIDRSFVAEIQTSSGNESIIKAIIAMAHSMKIKVVAEGVENERQEKFLSEHGCDMVQGYYYAKPQCSAETEHLLWNQKAAC